MAGARHVVLLNATPDESDMYAWWLESCGYRVSVVPDLDAVCRVATDDIVDVLVVDGVFGRRERALQLAEPLRRLSRQFGIVVLAGYLSDWSWDEPLSGHMYLLKPCRQSSYRRPYPVLSGSIQNLADAIRVSP